MKTKIFTLCFAIMASIGLTHSEIIERVKFGDLYYNLDTETKTAEVTRNYSDPYKDLKIANISPSVSNNGVDYNVTSIGNYAFENCSGITSVTIPNSVTSIKEAPFRNCTSLVSIQLPNSVTSIGEQAFYGCSSLISVTFGNNLESIESLSFSGCTSLVSIQLPNSVTSIKWQAFAGCTSLTSVNIPSSVTDLGFNVFINCTNLTSVTIDAEFILNSNVEYVFGEQVTEYIIGNNVTSIGDYAFQNCTNMKKVTIPNSVTSIGLGAFLNCSALTSVTIPESVTTINQGGTFQKCTSLTEVHWNAVMCDYSGDGEYYPPFYDLTNIKKFTFGPNVENIPNYLCGTLSGINSIDLPKTLKSIGEFVFYGCQITSITIPESVTNIADYAFGGCFSLSSLTVDPNNENYSSGSNVLFNKNKSTLILCASGKKGAYVIPSTVKTIKDRAFYSCTDLTSVSIPNGIKNIGASTFSHCSSLQSVILPNTLESLGHAAFYLCSSLESVDLGNNVKSIGSWAFMDCKKLTTVSLGENIASYGDSAFIGCDAITTIYNYRQKPAKWGKDMFKDVDYFNCTLHVLASSMEMYKSTGSDWNVFFEMQPIGAESTSTETLQVTPTENSVLVVWPTIGNAATSELIIQNKNGKDVCTLVFDANGILTQIAFSAPSRNHAPHQSQSAGFSFTVTGLTSGTNYDLTMTYKDNNGNIIDEKKQSFTTKGDAPTDINNVDALDRSNKILRDGQILILRGDRTYTLTGQEVK